MLSKGGKTYKMLSVKKEIVQIFKNMMIVGCKKSLYFVDFIRFI